VDLPVRRTFESVPNINRAFNPQVTFDYSRGVIKHLTAGVGVECPDGGTYDAQLNTTAYDMDPVRVDKTGRFRIAGAVLDTYGTVNHFVLVGRIRGHRASGTMSSYRYTEMKGSLEKCARSTVWRSTTTQSTAANGPAAYFEVLPFRYGEAGAWSYYLIVKLTGCAHANRVRVSVAGGAVKTTGCHGQAKLGPLAPKRTYRVRVTALRTRGGRVVRREAAVPATVYLPGEDGDWIRLR
jgi:hypothetical protein